MRTMNMVSPEIASGSDVTLHRERNNAFILTPLNRVSLKDKNGEMPLLMSLERGKEKSTYIKNLFELTYSKDIIERNHVEKNEVLVSLTKIIASFMESLTSEREPRNTYKRIGNRALSVNTVLA